MISQWTKGSNQARQQRVFACVIALDDYFYRCNDVKKIDFSCNTQFGAYCAEALRESISTEEFLHESVIFLDVGSLACNIKVLLAKLNDIRPGILVIVPCGRYRDVTYSIISKVINASNCLVSVLAGPCLPDEPYTVMTKLPSLNGVMLGDDFQLLGEVVDFTMHKRHYYQRLSSIPGFIWRKSDGSLKLIKCSTPPNTLGTISLKFRQSSIASVASKKPTSDNFRKWLIDSSSGCSRECIFCRTPIIALRQGHSCWRPRSALAIANEIEEVVNTFGISEFRFQDDNFLMNSPDAWARCDEFAEELCRRNLKIHFQIMVHPAVIANAKDSERKRAFIALEAVGLERVFMGIESGHDPTLNYFRKETSVSANEFSLQWLSKRHLLIICGAVVFHPRTTLEQLRAEYSFFRRWIENPRVASLAPLASYAHLIPGTVIAQEVRNRCLETHDEAEFRPADQTAARAMLGILELRRHLFPYDWFLFTVKRDLIHWERTLGEHINIVEQLTPYIKQASIAGIDATHEVIETAGAGNSCTGIIDNWGKKLYQHATQLSNVIKTTPFATHWRASLYDPIFNDTKE